MRWRRALTSSTGSTRSPGTASRASTRPLRPTCAPATCSSADATSAPARRANRRRRRCGTWAWRPWWRPRLPASSTATRSTWACWHWCVRARAGFARVPGCGSTATRRSSSTWTPARSTAANPFRPTSSPWSRPVASFPGSNASSPRNANPTQPTGVTLSCPQPTISSSRTSASCGRTGPPWSARTSASGMAGSPASRPRSARRKARRPSTDGTVLRFPAWSMPTCTSASISRWPPMPSRRARPRPWAGSPAASITCARASTTSIAAARMPSSCRRRCDWPTATSGSTTASTSRRSPRRTSTRWTHCSPGGACRRSRSSCSTAATGCTEGRRRKTSS